MIRLQSYLLCFIVVVSSINLSYPQQAFAQSSKGLEYLQSVEKVYIDLIAENEKSVVAISVYKRRKGKTRTSETDILGRPITTPNNPQSPKFIPSQYGTGVVIDSSGLILTNNHVLQDSTKQFTVEYYVTTIDRVIYRATKIGGDPRSDLAVLKIEKDRDAKAINLRPIKFGDGSRLQKGQLVISLGNPYAIARDGQASASRGMIANLSRKAAPDNNNKKDPTKNKPTLHHYGTLIQTDAKLNLGTSGSPLLNLKGEMIGLSTSIAAIVGYEKAAGYAIPTNETFKRAVNLLKQGKEVEYGLLGVGLDDITPARIQQGERGMKIYNVVTNTPADHCGLRREDIVTHINGKAVFESDGLTLSIGKLSPGSKVRLTVKRRNINDQRPSTWRTFETVATLTKYKVEGKKTITNRPRPWRGISVDYPSAVIGIHKGSPPIPNNCVCIAGVEKDSPAWNVGLRKGMLITRANGIFINTPDAFRRVVNRTTSNVVIYQRKTIRSGNNNSIIEVPLTIAAQ